VHLFDGNGGIFAAAKWLFHDFKREMTLVKSTNDAGIGFVEPNGTVVFALKFHEARFLTPRIGNN
jgi:hypothetical protein